MTNEEYLQHLYESYKKKLNRIKQFDVGGITVEGYLDGHSTRIDFVNEEAEEFMCDLLTGNERRNLK